MKLDWLKFVRDSQVFLASPRRVGHVTYGGIEIHPSPYGLSIGAEHFKTETGMNRLLITFFEDNRVELHAVISAQEPTLNPSLLVDALSQKAPELAPDFAKFTRIETFHENMEIYR